MSILQLLFKLGAPDFGLLTMFRQVVCHATVPLWIVAWPHVRGFRRRRCPPRGDSRGRGVGTQSAAHCPRPRIIPSDGELHGWPANPRPTHASESFAVCGGRTIVVLPHCVTQPSASGLAGAWLVRVGPFHRLGGAGYTVCLRAKACRAAWTVCDRGPACVLESVRL